MEQTHRMKEEIQHIPIEKFVPFPNHPFRVEDDDKMKDLLESIQAHGVLMPILARPYENGYQIVSGHRRHRACQMADESTIPVIVREMDDDTATMLMADANLQREVILPSEKAFDYQMKLDAMRRQNFRGVLNAPNIPASIAL